MNPNHVIVLTRLKDIFQQQFEILDRSDVGIVQSIYDVCKSNEAAATKLLQYLDAIRAYYSGETPIMSDFEFDQLESELTEVLSCEAPSEMSGKFFDSLLYRNAKYTMHKETQTEAESSEGASHEGTSVSLISLHKIKDDNEVPDNVKLLNELKKFFRQFPELSQYQAKFSIAPKFDGCALKIVWDLQTKEIKNIQSRGGLDVTHLLSNNEDIRKTIEFGQSIVCGELICKRSTFDLMYSENYANPRNFVGSLIKQKSIEDSVVDSLSFIPYSNGIEQLGECWNDMQLRDGLRLSNYRAFFTTDSDWNDYEQDGLVVSVRLEGHTLTSRPVKDNYPLNMVAIKFKPKSIIVKVTDIEWNQKKSGKLIPTVCIQPTELDGSVISRTAGFNYGYIKTNRVGIGSEIEIIKSGDIIPYIVRTITPSNDIPMPDCEYRINGIHLIGINTDETKKFKFLNACKILQLSGVGPVNADKIGAAVDYNPIELFDKSRWSDEIALLEIKPQLETIKSIRLDLLIEILQFDGVGHKLANACAQIMCKQKTVGNFSNIPQKVVQTVLSASGVRVIQSVVDRLKGYGVSVTKPLDNDTTLTYELTGNPPGMKKKDFMQVMETKYPQYAHGILTKETSLLITDDLSGNSSKMNKARKYNVRILTYNQILNDEISL